MKKATYELLEGINGSGNKIWCLLGETAHGEKFMHKFDTKAEAKNWIQWCL